MCACVRGWRGVGRQRRGVRCLDLRPNQREIHDLKTPVCHAQDGNRVPNDGCASLSDAPLCPSARTADIRMSKTYRPTDRTRIAEWKVAMPVASKAEAQPEPQSAARVCTRLHGSPQSMGCAVAATSSLTRSVCKPVCGSLSMGQAWWSERGQLCNCRRGGDGLLRAPEECDDGNDGKGERRLDACSLCPWQVSEMPTMPPSAQMLHSSESPAPVFNGLPRMDVTSSASLKRPPVP